MNSNAPAAAPISFPSETEIVMTRHFEAPLALVFEAFTRPEHLKRWWGPREMTLIVCETDPRPGGAYRMVQRKANGHEYTFRGVYREVVVPTRLVFTQVFEAGGFTSPEILNAIVFTEDEGGTLMVETLTFPTKEARDGMVDNGMEAGAVDSMARLDELLLDLQRTA